MDLVGIMLVVETPLAGKRDLTISAVGLILSILFH